MASLLEDLHSVAAEPSEQEEFWRREFEYAGYAAVKRIVSGTIGWDEPRRQFALQWLREKESEVVRREKQMQLDATRIEKDIEQLQQDLAELQRDTGRLLEGATRLLQEALKSLSSDAVVELFPGKDHGTLMDRKMRERISREMANRFRASKLES